MVVFVTNVRGPLVAAIVINVKWCLVIVFLVSNVRESLVAVLVTCV